MSYIKLTEDFIASYDYLNYAETVNEGMFKNINKSELEKIIGPTVETGKDIFETINKNVDDIEEAIEHYNDSANVTPENSKNKAEQLLTVEFDKNKLKLEKLIEATSLKTTSFTKDVFLSNIVNFRVWLSPIRMARIMALGYRYYMTIIRQTLQQALISVELYADMFFTLVRDGINGIGKENQELITRAYTSAWNQISGSLSNEYIFDPTTNKRVKMRKEQTTAIKNSISTILELGRLKKQGNDMYGSYRQNIYQEAGKHTESLMKDDNQKELAAMVEQFNNLAKKPQREGGGDNMLETFSQAVKLSAEVRANRICAKIHMNLVDILQMFSLRTQEGLSSLFKTLDMREAWEMEKDNWEREKDNVKSTMESVMKENEEKQRQIDDLLNADEISSEFRTELDKLGFNEIDDKNGYNMLIKNCDRKSATQFLIDHGFNRNQANDIFLNRKHKVSDYEPVEENGVVVKWNLKKE